MGTSGRRGQWSLSTMVCHPISTPGNFKLTLCREVSLTATIVWCYSHSILATLGPLYLSELITQPPEHNSKIMTILCAFRFHMTCLVPLHRQNWDHAPLSASRGARHLYHVTYPSYFFVYVHDINTDTFPVDSLHSAESLARHLWRNGVCLGN